MFAQLFYSSTLHVIGALLAIYFVASFLMRKDLVDKDGHHIPPGPLIRYLFLRKYPERQIHSWAEKYGPIYSVWMGSQLFVVISDPHVARDLLVLQGANFSGRWNYFMKNQTILRGRAITASGYNDTWRKHRKIAMSLLAPKSIQAYAHVLDFEAKMLIKSLYQEGKQGQQPVDPATAAGRYALNNMLTIALGTRTDSTSDPLVQKALYLGKEFMELTGPWSNIIDFLKPLQYIPTPMRSRARNLHNGFLDVYGSMILRVKARMDSGEDVPDCLMKSLIEVQETEKLSWEDMCLICVAFTTGGVHSTAGVIQWFLAIMPSNPEIQARAQEELDRVVGRGRWPTAEDEAKLPYIRAVIKEVLRLHSPFWIATPHCSEEDFVYNGLYIPKNTAMVLNCYSLHHNENRYPESRVFNPDRYLGDDLSSSESSRLGAMERDHWAFGAGRRICPGMAVAERELWLVISRLLWAFNIDPMPGEPISLEEYEGHSGRTPLPFKVKFSPRHETLQHVLDVEDVGVPV